MSPMKMLFSFEGRIRRRDWWIWTIASVILALVYGGVVGVILTMALGEPGLGFITANFASPPAQIAATLIFMSPAIWIQCALAAKRTHDRNQIAKPAIALSLISALFNFRPADPSVLGGVGSTLMMVLMLVAMGGGLYLLVTLGCLDGTHGPNRYGPSPKGIGGAGADTTADVFN